MARIKGNNQENTLLGTQNSDDIDARGGNDKLFGYAGNDDLAGGAGNDRLHGGAGNDDLEGGAGNDFLDGGKGRNDLEGGAGADTFIFRFGITDIEDYSANDSMQISKSLGVDNFSDLMALAETVDQGEDILIDFGNHELRFEDTRMSELKAADFEFI